ncbi:MAG: hypothetical protein FLDDKLPJ_02468 [Phycisphaerae bacterium]|nr:hypothetical protein [Phycisphaerae bacterium]
MRRCIVRSAGVEACGKRSSGIEGQPGSLIEKGDEIMRKKQYALIGSIGVLLSSVAGAAPPCGEWTIHPTQDPGSETNLLVDVAFRTPADGLTVGNWTGDGLSRVPMAQRWDGADWSIVALPDFSSFGTQPAVEGVGRVGDSLWIAGYVTTGYPTNNLPVMARWRDGSWDRVSTATLRKQNTYPFADRGGFGWDVAGVSDDDLWVVGTAVGYGDGQTSSVALALHYDGSGWEDVEVPYVGNRSNRFYALSVSASDNVWAVGEWRNIGGPFQAYIGRWDGSRWEIIPNPGEGPWTGDAEAVMAFAPDDVWVSGFFNNSADTLIHWDGSDWTVVDSGAPGVFAAFAATGPDDLWASSPMDATFYHYDGVQWSPAGGLPIPDSQYILRGWGMDALGTCSVWSVGGWSDGVVQYALAEQLSGGGAVDCGAVRKFNAKCRDGKLTAKVVSSLAEGTELTLARNGGDPKTVTINARGKGKAKWNGQSGAQDVCVVECPETPCATADCG